MLTDEQRYLFDLNGYLVLENVLDAATIKQMLADFDAHNIAPPDKESIDYRFGDFLTWGKTWRDLIDHPKTLPIIHEMLGPKFRLDHAYGMAMKADGDKGKGGGLHHQSAMFNHGCFYLTHGKQMHNGLIVVSFVLTDAVPGSGGFCCIPGSHKSLFPTPQGYFKLDSPVIKQIPVNAGDVLFFTEALTHGTMPWTSKTGERRSVLMKYCPGYMGWALKPIDASRIEGLTPRQEMILRGPYVGTRENFEVA